MGFGDKMRSLDIFKKVPKDFSEGTNIGGAISIITFASVVYLIVMELGKFLNPEMTAIIREDRLVTRKEMMYSPKLL